MWGGKGEARARLGSRYGCRCIMCRCTPRPAASPGAAGEGGGEAGRGEGRRQVCGRAASRQPTRKHRVAPSLRTCSHPQPGPCAHTCDRHSAAARAPASRKRLGRSKGTSPRALLPLQHPMDGPCRPMLSEHPHHTPPMAGPCRPIPEVVNEPTSDTPHTPHTHMAGPCRPMLPTSSLER